MLLSAGDTFSKTLSFNNVYEELADLAFVNFIGYEAMAVGNREVDRGPAALACLATLTAFPCWRPT